MEETILLVCAVVVDVILSPTVVLASSAGNTTVAPGAKIANGTTMTMPHSGIAIPIELNPTGDFAASNMVFYINTTDGALHLKGLLKNILHETISTDTLITLTFRDRSTDTVLKADINTFIHKEIGPGATIPFNIDTGYSAKQANEFQFIKALLTY
jgi:hypothetical protein